MSIKKKTKFEDGQHLRCKQKVRRGENLQNFLKFSKPTDIKLMNDLSYVIMVSQSFC